MGWTFIRNATKQTVIREILEPWIFTNDAGNKVHSVVIDSRLVGNSLWYVRETTRTAQDGAVTVTKWIGLSLLESSTYGWGHKDMDESMGPYDDTCPPEFLPLAPVPEGEFAQLWRNRIMAKAAPELARRSLARA